MQLIHNNLANLATLAAKENTKFAMSCVRLELDGEDSTYRAVVTDSKALAIVDGTSPSIDDYPELPQMKGAPNGATSASIPSGFWKEFLGKAAKMTSKVGRYGKEILRCVPVSLSAEQATMGATDLEKAAVEHTRLVEGRYPPYQEILPKQGPLMTISVDPDLLIRVLQVAKTFRHDADLGVELEVYDPNRPFFIKTRGKSEEGQTFQALVMPVGSSKENTNMERLQRYGELYHFAMELYKKAKEAGTMTFEELDKAKATLQRVHEPMAKEAKALAAHREAVKAEREALKRAKEEKAEKEAKAKEAAAQAEVAASESPAPVVEDVPAAVC